MTKVLRNGLPDDRFQGTHAAFDAFKRGEEYEDV